jgi:hypothetical protein
VGLAGGELRARCPGGSGEGGGGNRGRAWAEQQKEEEGFGWFACSVCWHGQQASVVHEAHLPVQHLPLLQPPAHCLWIP